MTTLTPIRDAARAAAPPRLELARLPGEFGPILQCEGALTKVTAEALRRELTLLDSLEHPVVLLDLAGCTVLEDEGLRTILECGGQLRASGRHLLVVTGNTATSRRLRAMGLDWAMPVFASEEAAARALRNGWPRLPGPESWAQAQAETMIRWQVILEALDEGVADTPRRGELLRLITSMNALCERAEERLQEHREEAATGFLPFDTIAPSRCHFCPLFTALGGERDALGCRSLLDPIIVAAQAGDRDAAGAQALAVLRLLRRLPLPAEPARRR